MRTLLIGGTGTISQHSSAALIAAGHAVTLFHRHDAKIDGADVIVGDRKDRSALSAAIDAVRPDVLMDFVCFQSDDAAALADAASGKVGHLVYVSTVDAIGFPLPTVPVSEKAVRGTGVGAYAIAKQQCEDLLLTRHRDNGLPLTIVRPTYSMSERFVISLFDHSSVNLFRALRAGRPVALPDSGKRIHASNSRDTGRMIARLGGEARAIGRTYTAGTKGAFFPQAEYLELIARVAGVTPKIVAVPSAQIDPIAQADYQASVYSNVTRYDLGFDFDVFAIHFPDFEWLGDLETPVRAYLERIERAGELDKPPTRDLETVVLEQRSTWAGAAR